MMLQVQNIIHFLQVTAQKKDDLEGRPLSCYFSTKKLASHVKFLCRNTVFRNDLHDIHTV